MNASSTSNSVLNKSGFGPIVSSAIAVFAIASIAGGLAYGTGPQAQAESTASLPAQNHSTRYFPAQFKLDPSSKEAVAFEY